MKRGGFTLIEILVYIGVLAIIIVAIAGFALWITSTNTKAKVMRETLNSSQRAMAIMTSEIRSAKSIYLPTTTSTQLSLETKKHLPEGEQTSYLDFFLCGSQLCLKKEPQSLTATSSEPIALTSEQLEVKNLEFTQVATTSTLPSLQISLRVDYKNPENRTEYQASVSATSTASLRSY